MPIGPSLLLYKTARFVSARMLLHLKRSLVIRTSDFYLHADITYAPDVDQAILTPRQNAL